jgi:hypothetical protein
VASFIVCILLGGVSGILNLFYLVRGGSGINEDCIAKIKDRYEIEYEE